MSQEVTTTPVAETVTAETTTVATEAKKAPGRPVVEGSKRQQRLAAQEARKASGVEIKPGRPKGSGVKVEVPATETPAEAAVPAEAATV